MESIQILNKNIKLQIKDGEEAIGVISFNPDDARTYAKFINLVNELSEGKKAVDSIKLSEEELNKKLETIEDFDNSSETFKKILKISEVNEEVWNKTCAGLDEIFGEGVCKCFTGDTVDIELLMPLINFVTPYFNKARKERVGKYKPKKQNDVM